MKVAVVLSWAQGNDIHRRRARRWIEQRYRTLYPEWEIIHGFSNPDKAFNRSESILNGASQTKAAIIVATDADVWVDPLQAVQTADSAGWSIPHTWVRRLSPQSTFEVVQASRHLTPLLELDQSNTRDADPYRGYHGGGIVVIRRDALFDVPPDVRFEGWGHEDRAWGRALTLLVGRPWQGSADLYHLWHPPQDRISRQLGSHESKALEDRYRIARQDHAMMRSLVDESKERWNEAIHL